jgi:hypothetical protein
MSLDFTSLSIAALDSVVIHRGFAVVAAPTHALPAPAASLGATRPSIVSAMLDWECFLLSLVLAKNCAW